MATKSKALERVEAREDQFGFFLSLNQIKKLSEIASTPEYNKNSPDGFLFVAGKGKDAQSQSIDTIEIIPYVNAHDPAVISGQQAVMDKIKYFEHNGVIGELGIDVGAPAPELDSVLGKSLFIDNIKEPTEVVIVVRPPFVDHCCSGVSQPSRLTI